MIAQQFAAAGGLGYVDLLGAPSYRGRAPPAGRVRIPGIRDFRKGVPAFGAARRWPRNQVAEEPA